MKIKVALLIFSNLFAVAIVAFVIFRLEAQDFALRLHLPAYPKLEIESAEKVDKKILINAIAALNGQYEYTENIYKKAMKTRMSLIYILMASLIAEVALLSITMIVLIRKLRFKNEKLITQQTSGADGV